MPLTHALLQIHRLYQHTRGILAQLRHLPYIQGLALLDYMPNAATQSCVQVPDATVLQAGGLTITCLED